MGLANMTQDLLENLWPSEPTTAGNQEVRSFKVSQIILNTVVQATA